MKRFNVYLVCGTCVTIEAISWKRQPITEFHKEAYVFTKEGQRGLSKHEVKSYFASDQVAAIVELLPGE